MRIRILVLMALWGSTALAKDVVVHRGVNSAETCNTEKAISITWNGNQGYQVFWESYQHVLDKALYVAVKGSRIDIYPNGATLSCLDEAAWKRLSEVVPNDGEEAITYLGECDISVPSKPHRLQIAFTPRYADVTEKGKTRQKKIVRYFENGDFSEKKVSLPDYEVENYRKLYTSCLNLVIH